MNSKLRVLRYAQLVLRKERLRQNDQKMSAEEEAEIVTIREAAGACHVHILDQAVKSLMESFEE